ncbi:hypothetical protein IQ247_10680 [Plectonema cf. radiosum LEGE 06105]|uniref:Uncharacterized protein n=1 Tax=Plectonema cf. radiosum LEGE 06105 TaxID=945769 RepID=A0A8J7K2J1_9CYAN|nr:hypothetical protein [Plectonema radiosum]MBE9213132.1 hypothetical protein [Plectonema cf. radiosum LEGE 06105]
MLKKITASVLTSIGLLTLNASPSLAKNTVNFTNHQTLYPSTCGVVIEAEKYTCDYAVMGAFDDASANIKLCSDDACIILMLSPYQLGNIANEEDFRVRQIALQKGSSIIAQWNVSMYCGFNATGMGCIGESDDGGEIAVYME